MPKYENSVIYKLCHCNDLENENIYIGSTTNFRSRKSEHKSNCNNENKIEYNRLLYQYIRNNGDWDEWQMIPIEKYPCNGKEELKIRERYHIELLKSKLNKQIPTRTKKEYYESNKDILNEKRKEYYEANKENILKQKKQYRENNRQMIAEKKEQYAKQKIICDHCNSEIRKDSLNRHQKTNKCKNYNITKE